MIKERNEGISSLEAGSPRVTAVSVGLENSVRTGERWLLGRCIQEKKQQTDYLTGISGGKLTDISQSCWVAREDIASDSKTLHK